MGVHHIEAHVLSNELGGEPLDCPCLVLVVSGGHTALYLASRASATTSWWATRATTRPARPSTRSPSSSGSGFPGGPAVQKAAERGDPRGDRFPARDARPRRLRLLLLGLEDGGAAATSTARASLTTRDIADIAASAQAAIVDVLVRTHRRLRARARRRHVYLAGGVAANGPLRSAMRAACEAHGIVYHAPLIEYCTDNGAMVARTAELLLAAGRNDGAALDVFTRGAITSWS